MDIPDDLIGLKAFMLWQDAGQPEGADFSAEARFALEREVQEGASIQVCSCQSVRCIARV